MRFVIVGLGGIGGTLAARLQQAGQDVLGVARGAHLEAIRARGLRLETPEGSYDAPLSIAGRVDEVGFTPDDVVVLAVKSQDTPAVLDDLALSGPGDLPVLCAQNGVANEPAALRFFESVYGVVVACPTTFLEAGVVRAYSSPTTGLLDVGRYPAGEDDTSREIARVWSTATFDSRSIPDVRRWKYRKLITNLGNAVEAVCGPAARNPGGKPGAVTEMLQAEGEAVLRAAGIDHATAAEDRARRGDLLDLQPVAGQPRPGGSAWQSLARGTGVTEVDYLCGEVVLLGRMYDVATPANALLQRLAGELARSGSPPGAVPEAEVLAQLDAVG